MNFSKPGVPDPSMLPTNNPERDIWNRYVIIGWNEGIFASSRHFCGQFKPLKRDYQGMILYRKLLPKILLPHRSCES